MPNLLLRYADDREERRVDVDIQRSKSGGFELEGRRWRLSYTYVEKDRERETETAWVVCYESPRAAE